MITSLLIKLHEGSPLTQEEQELVYKTTGNHNVSVAEAVALYLWSSESQPIQEQLKYGNTYQYVSNVLDALAMQMYYLTPDGDEIRFVIESLQNVCYADKSLAELYEYGRRIAPNAKMAVSICAAIRKIHIAVNATSTIQKLCSAIQKNSTDKPLTVYRALKRPVDSREVISRGLMSASRSEETSFAKYEEYQTVLKVHIPAGTPCVNVEPFSVYDTVEAELLFPPNVIRITEQENRGDRMYLTGIMEILDEFS